MERRVLAFNTIKMETNTKECGAKISATVKAHTGESRETSCEGSTQATGLRTKSMGEALSSLRMGTDMMGTG